LMKERGGDTGIDALGSPLAVGSEPALIAAGTTHLQYPIKGGHRLERGGTS
jgi:hypothetical protein